MFLDYEMGSLDSPLFHSMQSILNMKKLCV